MKFQTSITDIKNGEEVVRGHQLENLVQNHSFVETVFLILTKRLPEANEKRVFDAILTSVIDHGPGVASVMNARVSASAKNPIHASLAAGLLGFGDRHGMAVEGAMNFFQEHLREEDVPGLVARLKEQKFRIPGYGHTVFTDHDPRARLLYQIATDEGVYGEHSVFSLGVHKALNDISSRQLPLNVDGAIAAILSDMGFDPRLGNALFLIGRVPGLIAHIIEENTDHGKIRRIPQDDIEFVG